MRKDKTAPATRAQAADEHHLVAQLREAMAEKDIVTMGRMLELLGTIQAELVMGKPVIDRLGAGKPDPTAGTPPAKSQIPSPQGTPAARMTRQ